MSIVMTLEWPGVTTAQYDQVDEILGIHGDDTAPDGLVSHVCGETAGGIVIVDVWESEEALNQFFQERLGPAIGRVGLAEAYPKVRPVHAIIPQGHGTEANVIMMVDVDAGPDVYDEMVAQMEAHANGGADHPCTSHVAAVSEDGTMHIVDLWESPEAFDAFAQAEIAPAAAGRMGEIKPRFMPVYNRIRGRATANVY